MQTLRIRQLPAKPDSSTKDNIMISVGDELNRKKDFQLHSRDNLLMAVVLSGSRPL